MCVINIGLFDRYSDDDGDSPLEAAIVSELNQSKPKSPQKKKTRRRNGHRDPIDMTPPDKLLRKSEKKAKSYARKNKVIVKMIKLDYYVE